MLILSCSLSGVALPARRLAVLAVTAATLALLGACHRDGSSERAGGASARSAGAHSLPELDPNARGVIVVLGSSTAAGTGPSKPEHAWVERYRAYLKTGFPELQLINLAVGGYTTYQIQPSDYLPPGNRPPPDKNHNITIALTFAPKAIIINMPSNDANANYATAEQMANFERVTKLAGEHGISCWVTTAQPRNFTGDSQLVRQTKLRLLLGMKSAITQKYAERTLDFWSPFATAEGTIKEQFDAGDGTHLNDDAHALLVQTVIQAKIADAVRGPTP